MMYRLLVPLLSLVLLTEAHAITLQWQWPWPVARQALWRSRYCTEPWEGIAASIDSAMQQYTDTGMQIGQPVCYTLTATDTQNQQWLSDTFVRASCINQRQGLTCTYTTIHTVPTQVR